MTMETSPGPTGTLCTLTGRGGLAAAAGSLNPAIDSASGAQPESAIAHDHVMVGWNDVNAIRLDDGSIVDQLDRHCRGFGEEFYQQALVFGIQMLDHHEAHTCVIR